MDTNKQKAFVVHSKPYKETSLIVTFLTERNGKVDAVAKGAPFATASTFPFLSVRNVTIRLVSLYGFE